MKLSPESKTLYIGVKGMELILIGYTSPPPLHSIEKGFRKLRILNLKHRVGGTLYLLTPTPVVYKMFFALRLS